jgi:hypothetical protein
MYKIFIRIVVLFFIVSLGYTLRSKVPNNAQVIVQTFIDELFLKCNISVEDVGTTLLLEKISSISKKFYKDGTRRYFNRNIVLVLPDPFQNFVLKVIGQYEDPSRNYNISRVGVSSKMRNLIDTFSLKHVKVPRKYLIKIPNALDNLIDKNYVVIAEKLDISKATKLIDLNENQLDELLFIFVKSGLCSQTLGTDNEYFLEQEKKVGIIDTQDEGSIFLDKFIERLKPVHFTLEFFFNSCSWAWGKYSPKNNGYYLLEQVAIPLFLVSGNKKLIRYAKKILINSLTVCTKFLPFYIQKKQNKICLEYILSLLSKNEKIMLRGFSLLNFDLSQNFNTLVSLKRDIKTISQYEFVLNQLNSKEPICFL